MKTTTQIILFSSAALFLTRCSSGSFSGGGGSAPAPAVQKCSDGSTPGPNGCPPAPTPTPPAPAPAPTPTPVAPSSGGNAQAVVPTPIQFIREPDTAANTNCVYVTIMNAASPGVEQLIGCNKGNSGSSGQITFNVLPKPACNTIRLRMTTNGNQVWTTQNAANIATYFKPPQIPASQYQLGGGSIWLQCNDNGDADFNDMNLVINGLSNVNYAIENVSSVQCSP